jgi:hypothetical protein
MWISASWVVHVHDRVAWLLLDDGLLRFIHMHFFVWHDCVLCFLFALLCAVCLRMLGCICISHTQISRYLEIRGLEVSSNLSGQDCLHKYQDHGAMNPTSR